MSKYTFTNKEEYQLYRKMWKQEYKIVSDTLRKMKLDRKDTQRQGLSTAKIDWQLTGEKLVASDQLYKLKLAKEEAQRLYLQEKQK